MLAIISSFVVPVPDVIIVVVDFGIGVEIIGASMESVVLGVSLYVVDETSVACPSAGNACFIPEDDEKDSITPDAIDRGVVFPDAHNAVDSVTIVAIVAVDNDVEIEEISSELNRDVASIVADIDVFVAVAFFDCSDVAVIASVSVAVADNDGGEVDEISFDKGKAVMLVFVSMDVIFAAIVVILVLEAANSPIAVISFVVVVAVVILIAIFIGIVIVVSIVDVVSACANDAVVVANKNNDVAMSDFSGDIADDFDEISGSNSNAAVDECDGGVGAVEKIAAVCSSDNADEGDMLAFVPALLVKLDIVVADNAVFDVSVWKVGVSEDNINVGSAE